MSVTSYCALKKTDKCNIYFSKRSLSVFIFYFYFFLFFHFYLVCSSFAVIIHDSKKKKNIMRRKTSILEIFENCIKTKDRKYYFTKRYITNYYDIPLKIQKNDVTSVIKNSPHEPNRKYNYVTNIIRDKNRNSFLFFLYNNYFSGNQQIKKFNYHQHINKINIKRERNEKIYINTKNHINQGDHKNNDQMNLTNEQNCKSFNDEEKENTRDTNKILYLINPRGFCKGVSRAIETVEQCLKLFKPPIYVKHKIVHNDIVCKRLEKEGAIFIEDLNDVPDGHILIYSAHGISPQIREIAKKKKLIEIDATCPLVNKVHVYVQMKAKENYDIILIGYKNHVEVIGTYNEAPHCTHIVENINDVDKLDFPLNKKLFYVTQTTLSMDDCALIVQKLKNKFPHIETIPSGSICYATTNRQTALNQICTKCDLTIVVGSSSSSNAKKLVYSSQIRNVPAILLNTIHDLDQQILNNVNKIALTSAASTPEQETQKFVNLLTKPPFNYTLQNFEGVQENVPKWKLPKNLIDMIKEREK
ncbi:4-hydroxy-3-methylbut-2-enyl diphosphate reductase [Plasmodium sp. gorilla clade G3]|nr:4-hydroxy-3-methylbut-2-enyl diphosphate reductase [Plasmodium sp. gorilla clade G3]